MKRLHLSCGVLLLLAAPAPGASLTFTLNPSILRGAPGGQAVYQGTIANLGTDAVFLNDISVTFASPGGTYLTHDSNFFFANVPGLFFPGDTYTGPIFRLTIALDSPADLYLESATLLGGGDIFLLDPLGSQGFELNTHPPGAGGLMVPGDANGDGGLDISDPVAILWILFNGGGKVFPCGDGTTTHPANVRLVDWQPDGAIDISDAVATLSFLFLDGRPHALVPEADAQGCVPIVGCPDMCWK